ncbi:MAG: methyltransferase family protein [Clostridia bacterium]
MALLLFLPAGTLRFWNGWLFIGILFLPISITGIVMMIRNPELLKKRLNAKEKQKEQKTVIFLSGTYVCCRFHCCGIEFSFQLDSAARLVGIYCIRYIRSCLSYVCRSARRENEYLSRTVEVQKNQKVIDTGLYGIVRHPMYFATLFLFLSMGLVLGSPISFVIMLFYIPIIVKRINNEGKDFGTGT